MTVNEKILKETVNNYVDLFNKFVPNYFGVSSDQLYSALIEAIALNRPIPDDYDWRPGMPKDAVA